MSLKSQEVTPWIGPGGQVMRRLELHLTYHCPERCVFCSEDHRMTKYHPFSVSWGRVAAVLRKHAERGVKNVHLTGGEPTIHPRFVDVLKMCRKLKMRTSLGTIGTRLSQEAFAREAAPFLDEGLFSLHGPNAEVHDALTRREGSFERVVQAMKYTQQFNPDFRCFVNTVVTRDNIQELPDTVAFAESVGAELIVISNTTPEGAGGDAYERLAVPLEVLAEVLPKVPSRVTNSVVRFFGTPMCVMGEHWTCSNDLHWDPRVTSEWASAPGKVVFEDFYNWAPDRRRVQVDACGRCDRNKVCMGVFDRYVELWGAEALVPFCDAG
jgi:MoaA/NifB/PqqE/SkfB family radical SAM enzyme